MFIQSRSFVGLGTYLPLPKRGDGFLLHSQTPTNMHMSEGFSDNQHSEGTKIGCLPTRIGLDHFGNPGLSCMFPATANEAHVQWAAKFETAKQGLCVVPSRVLFFPRGAAA